MLEQGILEFEIDRKSSYMVGDKYADVQAGMAAGVSSILVRTGYGKEEEQKLQEGEARVLITYWPLLRIENKGRVCKMKLLCQILQKIFTFERTFYSKCCNGQSESCCRLLIFAIQNGNRYVSEALEKGQVLSLRITIPSLMKG